MALRRSRRLRGLAPEESQLEQVCFICQRGIDIGSLSRCQRTSCCGVFMHSVCHRQMVSRLPTCGNCRGRNDEFQREVVLETDEQVEEMESDDDPFSIEGMPSLSPTRVSRELTEYRRDKRYLYTHYPGSLFWPELPYELNPAVWLDYYHKTDLYTRMFEGSPLYLHAIVSMPCEVTATNRYAVYRMFLFNTPFAVLDVTNGFRFRFLFIRRMDDPNLRVAFLTLLPFAGGPPLYPDLLFCRFFLQTDLFPRT